jgi:hypothetical protein
MREGVAYLRETQEPGGGFALAGGGANSQSTAWAVQGLVAAGVGPSSLRRGGRTPFTYLRSLQSRDGHYRYSPGSDQTPVWVTAQALLATTRSAFPLAVFSATSSSASGGNGSSSGAAAAIPGPGGSGAGAGAGAGQAAVGGSSAAGGVAGAEGASPVAAGAPVEAEEGVGTSYSTGDDDSTLLWAALGALGLIAVAAWVYSSRQREPGA